MESHACANTMQTETPRTKAIHQKYCDLVGYSLAYSTDRAYWWSHWIYKGFTEADLELVIRHIQAGIKNGTRRAGALKWSNLIREAEHFEEELVEAKAQKRNEPAKPSVKDKWAPKPLDTAKHVSALLPDFKAWAKQAHEACERKEV